MAMELLSEVGPDLVFWAKDYELKVTFFKCMHDYVKTACYISGCHTVKRKIIYTPGRFIFTFL